MDKKIIIGIIVVLIVLVGILLLAGRRGEPLVDDRAFDMEESREIAENWIVNSAPTYVFDGYDLSLVDQEEILEGETYYFIFSFESAMAGYGDRTDEIVAQVITPHTIEVIVDKGEVIGAVTDGVYDEIGEEMIEEAVPETMTIGIYFVRVVEGQEQVEMVEREIPHTVATGRAAIEELLQGPTSQEEAEGFSTSINEGTELQSIDIQDNVAFVDFNERLEEGVAGSAWVTAIREQIEKTLLQFGTIEEVVISIEGRTEDILQP